MIKQLYRLNILKKSVTLDLDKNYAIPKKGGMSSLTLFMAKFTATAGFVGYVPLAQGTVGSLWGPVLYMVLPGYWFVHFTREVSLAVVGMVVILYFLGVWSAGVCETVWGHDPGRVVIDEVVGMLVTLAFVPLTLKTVWLGFFLFRAFDILKPPPVRWADKKLPGGWGVMSDDVIAGMYANVFLKIGMYFFKVLT